MVDHLNKKEKIYVIGGLIIIVAFVFAINMFMLSGTDAGIDPTLAQVQERRTEDVVLGSGAEVHLGDEVSLHYIGRLQDGTVFADSRKTDRVYTFIYGSGTAVRGWEDGLRGIKEGGVRRIIVPPDYGFSDEMASVVPVNTTYYYELEIISITPQKEHEFKN
jgi:FKBP-type peptidyl-prolyl cis-trans isomerase